MDGLNKDKNIELIEFLNQEKIVRRLHPKKVYTFYNKCLIKSIIELKNKFNTIDNKNLCLNNGISMIYYIFFVLIFYTNNIKLTIFLLERSILFYSEFIIMSQDKKLIDQICFVPNINDALFFTYKKTIGPIELGKIKVKPEQINIRDVSRVINTIYEETIFNCNMDDDNLLEKLNILQTEISMDIYSAYISLDTDAGKRTLNYLITVILAKEIDYNNKLLLIKICLTTILNYKNKNVKIVLDSMFNQINEYNPEDITIQNFTQSKLYKKLN